MMERSVLDEATELTRGDRNRDYGHPSDDFDRAAAMVTAYLGHPVTGRQLMGCMILVKMSRPAHTPDHWDSAVDIAGYADCIGRDIERERLEFEMADLAECPNSNQHCPGIPQASDDYGPWYIDMTRTHDLHQCDGCGQYVVWVPREPDGPEPVNQAENTGGSTVNVHPVKTAGYPPAELMGWETTAGRTRRGGDL